jgi:hypothetical protein
VLFRSRYSEFHFNKKNLKNDIREKLSRERLNLKELLNYNDSRFLEIKNNDINMLMLKEYASQSRMTLNEAIDETVKSELIYQEKNKALDYLEQQYIKRVDLALNNKQLMFIKDCFDSRKSYTDLNKSNNIDYIELIEDSVYVREMFNLIHTRSDDWLLSQNRQKSIEVQKDTESIILIDHLPDVNFLNEPTYHSNNTKKTVLYEIYHPVVNFLEEFAKKNNSNLKKVAITKILPGGIVGIHPDYGNYYLTKNRFHLAISGDYLLVVDEDNAYRPKIGDVFWFDNKLPHYALNLSNEPRISVIFDLEPLDCNDLKSKKGADIMEPLIKKDPGYIKMFGLV